MGNTWYQRAMPTVKDATPFLAEIVKTISGMKGVESVHICGSYLTNENNPNYPLKDLDIIVKTDFDSGDLMAIDAGPMSPLKMASNELEDFGFNPSAVAFTKKYLTLKNFHVDHWVTSSDNKILHWGSMPESVEEWKEIHDEAENYANSVTGYNRMKLAKGNDEVKGQWREAYSHSVKKAEGKQKLGWFPSDHPASEILATAKQI